MRITDDILYVGVNDHNIDLFEGQYIVPNGMAYNSYVINDENCGYGYGGCSFGDEWLKNIADVLNGATPDYLIIQHMEPDHSANIQKFAGSISEYKGGWKCKDIYNDRKLLP